MTSQTDPQAVGGVVDSRSTFKANQRLKQLFARCRILALLIAVAAIWLFSSMLTNGAFISPCNLFSLLHQIPITGMLARGMVFVIITSEIDLPVNSLLGLLSSMAAILDQGLGRPITAMVPAVLLLGVTMNLFNEWWLTYRSVLSSAVDLGGMLAYHDILLGLMHGSTIVPVSDSFVLIGQGYLPRRVGDLTAVSIFYLLIFVMIRQRREHRRYELDVAPLWQDVARLVVVGAVTVTFITTLNSYGGIPISVLLVPALLGVFSWIVNQTIFGHRIYSVGPSPEATRLSGINTGHMKLATFGLMGLMCVSTDIVNTMCLAANSSSVGTMGKLDVVTACFIGGTSARGGVGTVYGALADALVMANLDNDMSMLDVDAYQQMVVEGGILVLAVWVDVVLRSGHR